MKLHRRLRPGDVITAAWENDRTAAIERNAQLISEINAVVRAFDEQSFGTPLEDDVPGALPAVLEFTETTRSETTVTRTDSGTNTEDYDIATRIEADGTIDGKTVTLIINYASP